MAKNPQQKIPKIIHQIWIGNKENPYIEYMNSWKEKNPDWEYRLWTNEDLKDIVNVEQFDNIKEFCGKADIMRYEILYKYGGVYLDADLECIEPLTDEFLNNHEFFCWENEKKSPGLIANTIIGAQQFSPVMYDLIDSIRRLDDINKLPAWQTTGPKLVTNVAMKHGVTIYPSWYFLPSHYS